jgi:uncharacterized membrane protein
MLGAGARAHGRDRDTPGIRHADTEAHADFSSTGSPADRAVLADG